MGPTGLATLCSSMSPACFSFKAATKASTFDSSDATALIFLRGLLVLADADRMQWRPAPAHLSQLSSGLVSSRLHLTLDSLQATHALGRLAMLGAGIESGGLVYVALSWTRGRIPGCCSADISTGTSKYKSSGRHSVRKARGVRCLIYLIENPGKSESILCNSANRPTITCRLPIGRLHH